MITSFEQFRELARDANLVPVVQTVLADLQTPLGMYLAVAVGSRQSFLLESIEGGERVARFSFAGADPYLAVRGRGNTCHVRTPQGESQEDGNAVEYLRQHMRERRFAAAPDLPPFAGGAIGYLAYEAAEWFEPALKSNKPTDSDQACFLFFDTIFAFDRLKQQIQIVHNVHLPEKLADAELRAKYDAACNATSRLAQRLEQRPVAAKTELTSNAAQIHSNMTRDGFESSVTSIRESIFAGDCYQAVLSQRFEVPLAAAPVDVYRALRLVNPSPYMFFLALGDEHLIGSSPEMLVRCRAGQLEYRPIAGTRPRGASPEDDDRLSAELLADEKENAEHVMLVDLGRNDLGKVARIGSVKVDRFRAIERYSHVQHIVSQLSAQLRPGLDSLDALAACFPAGTVTGAPKIRAMQILRDLERQPRGVYAGSVFYLDFNGNLDSCIAIRTMHVKDGTARVQAGAGIVADSVPASEFDETVNKARALFRAIEVAQEGVGQ